VERVGQRARVQQQTGPVDHDGRQLKLVDRRGQVTAEDLRTVRDVGWNDEEIVEVIGQVALNLFTNYVNIALDVPVDFPDVPLR
jgi:hypothetical protein